MKTIFAKPVVTKRVVRFSPGNQVLYGQDFHTARGVPSGIDFTVEEIDDTHAVLSAPGYGGRPYGNGKIWISRYANEKKETK